MAASTISARADAASRWLDLTTNAPAGVALPKFKAKPYFARWTTPMDPSGGRWLCFDRSRASGPYDLMYFDGTGNGRLDDKTAMRSRSSDSTLNPFDPAKVVFKGDDGPITYHLVFEFYQPQGSEARVLVESGGYYSGTVDFGGKKKQIELIDENINGTFNDVGPKLGQGDLLVFSGDNSSERYLGKMIDVDGQFYHVEVAREGDFVKVQKVENVVLGKVQVPESVTQFAALGENGHFSRKPAKGELTLPVGKYRVWEWQRPTKDSKNASWLLTGSGSEATEMFEVTEAKPVALQLGDRLHGIMTAQDASGGMVEFDLKLQGNYGEKLTVTKAGTYPPGPKLTVANVDGSPVGTGTFEFG